MFYHCVFQEFSRSQFSLKFQHFWCCSTLHADIITTFNTKTWLPHQRLSQRHIAWDTCALGHSPPITKTIKRKSRYHLRQQIRRWNLSSSSISCTINFDSSLTQLGEINLSISLFWRLKFWTRNSSEIIIIFDKLYQYSPKSTISAAPQKRRKEKIQSTSNR